MRFVVVGAGAVGGVVGGRLFQAGHDVTLVARGAHLAALQAGGLRIESPDGQVTLPVPAIGDPSGTAWSASTVALLAVKSHQTAAALAALSAAAPPETPVVCLQNGIANEPAALRLFAHVHAVNVLCPATHLEPGVVQVWSRPLGGLLDLGRYPAGVDATTEALSQAFCAATFDSRPRPDIWRWKLRKLLVNLGNVIEAACGHQALRGELAARVRAEGAAVFDAAGLVPATAEEDRERWSMLELSSIEGRHRSGGSTWQSLRRGTGDIETDYLNGEIVLLGRLHGVPTPANELMQRVGRELALGRRPPGELDEGELLARLPPLRPTML